MCLDSYLGARPILFVCLFVLHHANNYFYFFACMKKVFFFIALLIILCLRHPWHNPRILKYNKIQLSGWKIPWPPFFRYYSGVKWRTADILTWYIIGHNINLIYNLFCKSVRIMGAAAYYYNSKHNVKYLYFVCFFVSFPLHFFSKCINNSNSR